MSNYCYTKDEAAKIKRDLDKQLGPEFISKRQGPGYNSIQYLEGWKAINLANGIFGPTGWNTELRSFQVDYVDQSGSAISMGVSAIVRVSLKDGTFHEDVGYGSIDNCKTKSAAFDKCKKEAVTDGMKRALRQFGNALGNCLYDKDFLQKVTRVSHEPKRFDERNLLRATEKRTITMPQVDRGRDEVVHRDVPVKEETPTFTTANGPAAMPTRPDRDDDSFVFSDDWPEEIAEVDVNGLPSQPVHTEAGTAEKSSDTPQTSAAAIPANVTFVSAGSAEKILNNPAMQSSLKYDASQQSPTISKSHFINHSKSAPVKRSHVNENKENAVQTGKRVGLPATKLTNKRLRK